MSIETAEGSQHASARRRAGGRVSIAAIEWLEGRARSRARLRRAVELARLAKDSTNLQVKQAAESLRIAQGQYNAGLAQFNVVNEQQRELVRAQGAQTQATYDYMEARARFDQVIGREVLREGPFEEALEPSSKR